MKKEKASLLAIIPSMLCAFIFLERLSVNVTQQCDIISTLLQNHNSKTVTDH